MSGLYDDPLVYDVLHTPGTAAEVDGLLRIARRFLPDRKRARLDFLEPACGTGRYLRVLAARGHHAAGFDRDDSMLAFARAALRRRRLDHRVRVFRADMTRFAAAAGTARFDIAFNLFNTLRHLETDAAVLAHLRETARVLRPGGLYLVGLSLVCYGVDDAEEDVWAAQRGGLRVRQIVQYLPPGRWPAPLGQRAGIKRSDGPRWEIVVSHLSLERRSGNEHRDSVYGLRCYDAAQWDALLARSPFRRLALADGNGRALVQRLLPYAIDVLVRAPRIR